MPPASHMICRPKRLSRCSRALTSVVASRAPGGAERVAEGDGAAVDVDLRQVGADLAGPRQHDRGEGLVDLEQVDVARATGPALASTLWVTGMTAVSMNSGSSASTAVVWMRARGRRPSSAARSALAISRADGAVGDLRRRAGGDRPVDLREAGLDPLVDERRGAARARPSSVVARRPSSAVTRRREPSSSTTSTRHDLVAEHAPVGGAAGELLGAQAELVELGRGRCPTWRR